MENKKSKGISPVIATIIMVAVAIVISIAAAFWLTGLMGTFTTYENIRISTFATRGSGGTYTITVIVINLGPIDVSVIDISVPGYEETVGISPDPSPNNPQNIAVGEQKSFVISGLSISDIRPGNVIKIIVATTRATYEGQVILP